MSAPSVLFGSERCVGCRRRCGPLCDLCARSCAPAVHVAPPKGIHKVVSPWAYEGAARALVLDLKLRGRRSAAHSLASALHREVVRSGLHATTLCWVPGRAPDTRRRGFDHARLLATCVGHLMGLPARPLLVNARERVDQSGLSGAQRRRNLAGAFSAVACEGTVALVDDVMTTGATASSCARALRAAGARRVELLCACVSA